MTFMSSGAQCMCFNPKYIRINCCWVFFNKIVRQTDRFWMCALCVPDHSLLVPPHLQELYDMYMRELDERKLDRAMALDKVTTRHTIKVTCMEKHHPNSKVVGWPRQILVQITGPLSFPGGLSAQDRPPWSGSWQRAGRGLGPGERAQHVLWHQTRPSQNPPAHLAPHSAWAWAVSGHLVSSYVSHLELIGRLY